MLATPCYDLQDLMCPPEDVVLQQLRNARKDMLKVRFAWLMLSPCLCHVGAMPVR